MYLKKLALPVNHGEEILIEGRIKNFK